MRWAKPDVIFTQYYLDKSTDHAVTGDLVGRLMLSLPGKNIDCGEPPTDKVPSLFYWDVAAGLGFDPEAYVDISGQMDAKLAALACHKSQFAWMENFVGPSLTDHCKTLSQFRGLALGTRYAEGFRAYRIHGFMADFRLLP
jgi:N-acetylglucosamine malate deacetylase 1